MALYKIIRKTIETLEQSYLVEGDSEDEALGNYNGNQGNKVYPQETKNYKETQILILPEL